MITKEEFDNLISKRASGQFSRDVYRLGVIMSQNFGKLSIDDMQKIIVEANVTKGNFFKKIVGKDSKVMTEEENDRYFLMQLAFKIMDIKGVTMLTLEDLSPRLLRPVYLKQFKKEYEDYERREYMFRDVPFQERAMEAMLEFKGREISIENELI